MRDDKALYTATLCAAASLALIWKWRQKESRPPYPPGPRGYPLIGNVLDIPRNIPIWQALIPMAQKFGMSIRSLLEVTHRTEDFAVLRYGRIIPQAFYNRLGSSE